MSGLFRGLFGGSQTTSKPVDVTPKPFKAIQQPFADVLQGLLGQGGASSDATLAAIPSYTGPLTAPIGANESSLLADLMQSSSTGMSADAQALLSKTLQGGFLPGESGSNPFLAAAIEAAQRPTLQGLTETLTRDLPGRFTSAGQFVQPGGSSAFDRAAAIATRGATQAMADIATKLSASTYEAERARQQEAVPLSQQQVESTIANLQAQALPRLIQEYGIERGLDQFKTRISALLQLLGVTQATTSPTVGTKSQGTSTTGAIPAIGNFIGNAFPAAPGG